MTTERPIISAAGATSNANGGIAIPYRLAFARPGRYAVKGAPGSHGDAGYTIERALSPQHALVVLTEGGIGPQAWMPGTKRVACAVGVVCAFAVLVGVTS